jgi:nitrate reductase beta subunit
MRRYMRAVNLGGEADPEIAEGVGMEPAQMEAMFRMVAIGDYDERYVIPRRHGELSGAAFTEQGSCGLDFPQQGTTPSLLDGSLLAQSQSEVGGEGQAAELDLLEHLHRGGPNGGDGDGMGGDD